MFVGIINIIARSAPQTTAAVTKLKVIRNNNNIVISSKISMINSLVMSILICHSEQQEHRHQLQDQNDEFPGHVHINLSFGTTRTSSSAPRSE